MFIIAKEFQGKEVSRVEDPNPERSMGYLQRAMLEISLDPRFSLKISVQPRVIVDLAEKPKPRHLHLIA